jgi:hypothetical protein
LAFAPSSSFLLLDLLNQVQLRHQGWEIINVDGLRQSTQLFVQIASWRSGMAISKSLILETFLKKLKNQGFKECLLRSGFRDLDYAEWSKFVMHRAKEYNETRLAAKMMGFSLQDGKSLYGKTSEPSHRQRGSQEFPEEKDLKNQGHRSSPGERSQKCYGCGHVTTPPHRKKDCPHKERPGWGAPTVMTKPLLLVAMSCENVAIFEVFIEGLGAKVGLDSMSSSR